MRARNLHRTGVGNRRRAVGSVQAEPGVKAGIAKLGGSEGEVNVFRVSEVDLVVIPAVAGVGEDVAASRCCGFQRMSAEHPVAEVDDVDVLLHQDVSGEGAIPEPVAQAVLVGRGAGVDLFL